VVVPVQGDLVAPGGDVGGHIPISLHHATEHEERRPPSLALEGGQDHRRRTGVRAVVERQGDMVRTPDPGERRGHGQAHRPDAGESRQGVPAGHEQAAQAGQ
jgi:hypothetical protein